MLVVKLAHQADRSLLIVFEDPLPIFTVGSSSQSERARDSQAKTRLSMWEQNPDFRTICSRLLPREITHRRGRRRIVRTASTAIFISRMVASTLPCPLVLRATDRKT